MTEGIPWKHILWLALPMLIGFLLQQLYTMADMIIVCNFLGENALSVGDSAATLYFLMISSLLNIVLDLLTAIVSQIEIKQ